MSFYSETKTEVLNKLSTNSEIGLSDKEIQARQSEYGPNKLREKKKKTSFQRFVDQFKDAMILILIAAAIISFAVVCAEQNWGELFEPLLIILIVILKKLLMRQTLFRGIS